jgi:hypothetical protein
MEALQPSLRFMLPLCACCRSRLSRNSKTPKSSGPASSRQPAAFDVRHTAAYDWRRIHSATPQRNALTYRDGCAFLSGEGSACDDSDGSLR